MSLWAGRMCSEKAHEGNLRNHWWAQCFLTREAPKQFPAKNAARICRHLGAPRSQGLPESRKREPRSQGWRLKQRKTAWMFRANFHRLTSVGFGWEKKTFKERNFSEWNVNKVRETNWMVCFDFRRHVTQDTHLMQLISSHFFGPPFFFVDQKKRCENVERLPQTTSGETCGEKTSKNNQSLHIRIPHIGLYNGDDSTVSKPISIHWVGIFEMLQIWVHPLATALLPSKCLSLQLR